MASLFLKLGPLISPCKTICPVAKHPANVFDTPYDRGVKPRAQLD
jgi:hypothetical protein